MEQSPPPHPAFGVPTSNGAQMAYAAPSYQQPTMAAAPPSSFPSSSPHLSFQQAHQFHLQQQHQQHQQLQAFWADRVQEIEQTTDFRNHSLPLARIKKIMKADEDVRMISAEAPVVFAKACEIFILELTLRSWINTEENKRRTLQKNDIAAAITRNDIFDFLVDIVPRDELKEDGLVFQRAAGLPMVGGPVDALPYYYLPQNHQLGASGMFMGKNMEQSADTFAGHHPHPNTHMAWQIPQAPQEQEMPDNS